MVFVQSRSKSLCNTEVGSVDGVTLKSVLKAISKNNKGIDVHRLRLTYLKENKQVPITTDRFFTEESVEKLYVKDLGPQISWRLVFVCEYLGPILIHTALYFLSKHSSLNSAQRYNPYLNKLAYFLVLAHYTKREVETIFVHKFSQDTMPLFNLFKNCFHYWVLNGLIGVGYFGKGFFFNDSNLFKAYSYLKINNLSTLVALFAVFELWNFYAHVKLRLWGDYQRKLGNTKTRLPLDEGIFKVFVSPNYTFELLSWITFTLVFKLNLFAVIFTLVSGTQMYLWAQKKNKKYGTRRAFLIPYIF
ncbi:probable Very-long-chain enoyl-CoA reductase [Zygosaccharomyces bailii]|nr:probable Very-long-chain enoyl-CoA reductase [Zygosaccharomyces bailii]